MWRSCDSWPSGRHYSGGGYYYIYGAMWCIFCIVWAFALFALLKGIWRLVCLTIARRREAVEATVVECNSKRDLGSEVYFFTVELKRHGIPWSLDDKVRLWGRSRRLKVGDTLRVYVNDLSPWGILGTGRDFFEIRQAGYIGWSVFQILLGILLIASVPLDGAFWGQTSLPGKLIQGFPTSGSNPQYWNLLMDVWCADPLWELDFAPFFLSLIPYGLRGRW